jgi:sodium/proline symporter
MAAESLAAIPQARRIGMTWMVLCLFGAMAVGFFGIAWFAAHPDLAGPVTANHERVFIELSQLLFNPWVAGVLLSAILAAIMSTLSCQLLVCSSALTEDFYKGFFRKQAGQAELVWVGRLTVLGVALLAIWLASDPDSRVLGLVSYAWAGFGAAFGPVVLFSLGWKGMTRNGALAGMVVGAATVILWKEGFNDGAGSWFHATGLYEMVPGFLLASVAIVVASRLGAPPSTAMDATFDAVQGELRATGT